LELSGFYDFEAEHFDASGVREMELKSNQRMGQVEPFGAVSVPI
jgi:hypothetical protein